MSCSCQTNKKKSSGNVSIDTTSVSFSVPGYPVHSVHPDESCIFCALKHASVAYTMLSSAAPVTAVIGELELARRHTLLEFPRVAGKTAEAELWLCLRDRNKSIPVLEDALGLLQSTADSADGSVEQDSSRADPFTMDGVPCPFIGEVHFGAAWRLAAEIGYMGLNRSMIIGDLALAQGHFIPFDAKLDPYIRELRHRVEKAETEDLNLFWPVTAKALADVVESNLKSWRESYINDLKRYIGA